jgi:membrane protein EpsK
MGSFLVRTWGGNFSVSLFAFNRLDLQNLITSINSILQVLLIIILFYLYSPRLSFIGYSYLLAAIITLFITIIFSKKVNPYLKVDIHSFRMSQVKDLSITGGWIIIDQIGTLLLLQIDLILVNKLFGVAAGGEYSIALTWSTLIMSLASMFAGVLTPVILTYYAKEKFEEMVIVSKSAVKIMGLSMALPIGLICGFSPLILSLWIGPDFTRISPLMWILLVHLAVNQSVLPLFPINVSYNKLRIPAIATVLFGIANLLLVLIFLTFTEMGYYGVAIAGAIVITARHTFFVPMYATKVLGISKNPFKSSLVQVSISTILVAGITCCSYYFFNISSPLAALIYCFIFSLIYLIISLFIILDKSEREILESLVPSFMINLLKTNGNRDY